MFTHPYIGSKLHHDRHRDMRVDVGQHRLARQARILAKAYRHGGETPRRQRRPWRRALRQRPAPGQARAS
jgi:hypothetical protein